MGFEKFDRDLTYAGVLFNQVGSKRHLAYLSEALEDQVEMPCLGGVLREQEVSIPERHLGLVTSEDHPLSAARIKKLATLIDDSINIDRLLERLPEISIADEKAVDRTYQTKAPARIGVARDNAFCFYYPDNLELLEAAGAELVFFSPISDRRLPRGLNGLYLGGGYPELAADRLSANMEMRNQIHAKSQSGMPIYAECGGFMYLCDELVDQSASRHTMVGCFPFTAQMNSRLKALGYREITLTQDTILGPAGQAIRGHEFHYSELKKPDSGTDTVYHLTDRIGVDQPPQGYYTKRTLGSYTHLHFGSQPQVAEYFVSACADYGKERIGNETG